MAGIYIHIPFCRSKCIYCDFYSRPQISRFESLVDGLIEEFQARRNEIAEPYTTIYIGGGTPSILPIDQLSKLVTKVTMDLVQEFTIEANPDDVTREKVLAWKDLGVNRVSLGVQTFNDKVLRQIGRRHDSHQAVEAIHLLNENGIGNISADLIYGLPGIDQEMWEADLKTMLSLPISHMSAYCLTFNEGTMLYKLLQKGKVREMSDDDAILRFEALRRLTAEAGFEHYEISNFAKPGYRSKHNSSYWNPRHTWLGIGPSAHSFDGRVRRIDYPNLDLWLKKLPRPYEIDEETQLDRINDIIVTSLRTVEGLDIGEIPEHYREGLLRDASEYIDKGFMTLNGNYLSIPPQHWLMSDCYIRDLIII